MGTPIVSVVVTCFNYGRFVPLCVRSVLDQTFADLEVIIIDDGSTDDTAEVVQPFLRDSRVTYHPQPNQGQAVAKNRGIALSKGEFVAFLDADDMWLPTKLARQLPLFDDPAVGVTYTEGFIVDGNGDTVWKGSRTGAMAHQRGQVTRWMAFENIVPFSSAAVRRRLLAEHGGFDESLGMGIDWDLWLRLSCVTKFDYVEEHLLAYRVGHTNQMSRNIVGRVAASERIFSKFMSQHPDALSARDIRAVDYYNACSRGYTLRGVDDGRSREYFLQALRLRPWSPVPYRELLRTRLRASRLR